MNECKGISAILLMGLMATCAMGASETVTFHLDNRMDPRIPSNTEDITFFGGGAVNVESKSEGGSTSLTGGVLFHMWIKPTTPGIYVLTHNTTVDGGEVNYTATFHVPGVAFASATKTANEGSVVAFTVYGSAIGTGTTTVGYRIKRGGSATETADYTLTAGNLTWSAGDSTSKTFNLSLLKDAELEPTETVIVELHGDGTAESTVSIIDRTVLIKSLQIAQRYPWNGLVDISFTTDTYANTELIKLNVAATHGSGDDSIPINALHDMDVNTEISVRTQLAGGALVPVAEKAHYLVWNTDVDRANVKEDVKLILTAEME